MQIYQHDSAKMFRFDLRGDLVGHRAQELEHAWTTAQSILNGKELVVDVSGIEDADEFGVDLLCRMRDSGARLIAALPPEPKAFLRTLGLPAAAPGGQSRGTGVLRILKSVGVLK